MRDNADWTLEQFMAKKSREAGGGQFYAVYNRGSKIRTEWGRTIYDVQNFLNRMEVKFDKVVKLA